VRPPRTIIPRGILILSLLAVLVLIPSCSALELELNDDEFTNDEILQYTVRGEPYQNCTVLFADNKRNIPYDSERITLNATGVYIGTYDLSADRNYDVTHLVSVQNRSSSDTKRYELVYSDAQRFKENQEMRAAIWGAVGVVLGLIVVIVLLIAFKEKEKRLKAEGKPTGTESGLHLDKMMNVFDKNAPSDPKQRHWYQMRWAKHFIIALKKQIRQRSALIAEAYRWMGEYPALKRAVIENLKKEKLWPMDLTDEKKVAAFLSPGEPTD
jgi:hypothetical protein